MITPEAWDADELNRETHAGMVLVAAACGFLGILVAVGVAWVLWQVIA